MRVPQNYRHPAWQRFFSGIAVGVIIGYVFFLVIYGLAQERQIEKINEQATKISQLNRKNQALKEEKVKENEALEKQMKVQEIEVSIKSPKYKLERLIDLQLQEQVATQLHSIINKSVDSVGDNYELIYRAVEGHGFVIDDHIYRFTIKTLVIKSVIILNLELTDVENL
ncbi:sporulation membrane protein YtrI [Camelliibacillus cellulosilyticus]|uniref:Sporulation membrane protein YtrI n=1 Tax=Camelliibacillus cellulosilyticus TaxID=2174486 RepID=A0ABV9GJE0_9BACL